MRCLTLADTLARRGWHCAFACRGETMDAVAALSDAVHAVKTLQGLDDPGELRRIWPDGCDLLVVDHYRFDAGYESGCRDWAEKILVIDDLADRPHDCDVLLDQTVGRRGDDYADLVPPSCGILTGSAYALLRPQFAANREAALDRRQNETGIRRVLVSCGATDPDNVTATVLDGLAMAAPDVQIDVALGGAAPHLATLSGNVHVDHEDMAGLMMQADLAIGAAGTSAWERCCMGLPTLMVLTADNQRTVAGNLAEAGAAILIGEASSVTAESVAGAFRAVANDAGRLADMSAAASLQCNGLGARLLASMLDPQVSSDGKAVSLRPATSTDGEVILAWQQRPETRRYSHNSAIPEADEHAAWMVGRLKDPGCIFLMIIHGDEPAGVLRLERTKKPNGAGQGYRISIFISPDKHRLGIGSAALLLAEDVIPDARLIAEVLPDNRASHALFERAGFERNDGYYTWNAS